MLEELGPLLATPLLAGIMASNQSMRDSPALQSLFIGQLKLLALDQVKEAKRTRAAFAEVAELGEEAEGLIAGFLSMLFAPGPGRETDAADRAGNVHAGEGAAG
jgi:hypothetical protein